MWSIFRALKRSWAQHFISQFSGLMILTLSYSAVLFIALALTNVERIFSVWGQVQHVTVYLKNEIKKGEIESLTQYLKDHEIVKSFKLIDSQQAAVNFKERFKDLSSQNISAQELGAFFPAFYEVELIQAKVYSQSSTALDEFADQIKKNNLLVTDVSYGKSWLVQYISMLKAVNKVGWTLIFVFLMGSLVVSSNVVKTILFHRKDEIEVLEFIGADDRMIYLPQLMNVIVISSLAFLTAVLANYSIYYWAGRGQTIQLSELLSQQVHFIPWTTLLLLTLISISSLTLYTIYTIRNLMPRQRSGASS